MARVSRSRAPVSFTPDKTRLRSECCLNIHRPSPAATASAPAMMRVLLFIESFSTYRGPVAAILQRVLDEYACQAGFLAVPLHESLAHLLPGLAIGPLEGLVHETRLACVLAGLHARLSPWLLRFLEPRVEEHLLYSGRGRHPRAYRDARGALLAAFTPSVRSLRALGPARADHDGRCYAFLALAQRVRPVNLGFDLPALGEPGLLQPHRGSVDLREPGFQFAAQGIPVFLEQRQQVLGKREPADRRRDHQNENKEDRPAPRLLRDGLSTLAFLHLLAPGQAQLDERGEHRGGGADERGDDDRVGKVHGAPITGRP